MRPAADQGSPRRFMAPVRLLYAAFRRSGPRQAVLPEEDQPELDDAFHLQARYDRTRHQVILRVTIHAEAVGALTEKIHTLNSNQQSHKTTHSNETVPLASMPVTGTHSHVVGAPGGACRRSTNSLGVWP